MQQVVIDAQARTIQAQVQTIINLERLLFMVFTAMRSGDELNPWQEDCVAMVLSWSSIAVATNRMELN